MTKYLDLIDYLLIAEAVTGIQAEVLAKLPRIDLAESALHAPQASLSVRWSSTRSSPPRRRSYSSTSSETTHCPTATSVSRNWNRVVSRTIGMLTATRLSAPPLQLNRLLELQATGSVVRWTVTA